MKKQAQKRAKPDDRQQPNQSKDKILPKSFNNVEPSALNLAAQEESETLRT